MTFADKLGGWFRGNQDAVDFALCLYEAIQQWDDIEDEGQCEDHNAMIAWWAFDKEHMPFFARNAATLRPVLHLMYLQWRAANVLDHGTRADVDKSYMLRAAFFGVLHMIAAISGGTQWAVEIGPEIYREYAETTDSLWKEFNDA